MQILYCDDCGTRVDEAEAAGADGKTYCQQCVRKHVPVHKSGGVATLPPSSRSTRASKLPRTTPVRNLAMGAGAPIGAHGVDTRYAATNNARADNEIHHPPPSSRHHHVQAPLATHVALYRWASENVVVAVAVGGGTLALIVFLLWNLSGTNDSFKRSSRTSNNTPAKTTVATPTVSEPTFVPATKPEPKRVFGMSALGQSSSAKTDEPDPREDKAARDLKVIKDMIAAGKSNPFDIRRRLDQFVAPYWIKKTAIGVDAAALLEKFKVEKRPPDAADGAVPGIQAGVGNVETFNTDFNSSEVKTIKDINFDSTGALKANFGRDTNVALKFTGFIEIAQDGDFTFYSNSDDGSYLYIGDTEVVNNGGDHPITERDGAIALKAGKHRFRVEYYNGTGLAGMILSWSGPGTNGKQVVPASAYSSNPKK